MKRASCGLLYGAMNTTKTTNLGRIARYLYEKYGLTSRLITADNEHDTLDDLIEAGVIEVFTIVAVPNPFPVMTKLSQGYWPVVIGNRLTMQPTPPTKMAKIGAYLIEGTTTIGELLHEDHIRKARAIGEDVVGKFSEAVDIGTGSETLNFAKSGRAHYQHVQDFVTLDLIPTFSMLPVPWVWWTGHEYAGEDEATGKTRLGPGVVGKAATMKVPRKLGNTFHLAAVENTQTDARTHKSTRSTDYRAYFEPHADREMAILMWPAGVKIPAQAIPSWRERFPEGYIPLTLQKGVEQYVQFHDEIAASRDKVAIVPGTATMPGRSAEISGEVAAQQVGSASTVPGSNLPPAKPVLVSQIRPPFRPWKPSLDAPTLAAQLDASVKIAQQNKQAEAKQQQPAENVVPDINAVPVEKEPA